MLIFCLLGIVTVLVLALGLLLLSAQPAHAALPPQTDSARASRAVFVVIGTVGAVTQQTVKTASGSDEHYCADVLVAAVEASMVPPGCTSLPNIQLPETLPESDANIAVYYKQTRERPVNWVGPTGQSAQLPTATKVRLYLTIEDGKLALLEPNGWEKVDS